MRNNFIRGGRRWLAALLLLLFIGTVARSQGLRGVVLNMESGAPVARAWLLLTPVDKANGEARTQSADEEGMFHFPDLRPGQWEINVTRAGFRPLHLDVRIPSGEERDMIIHLSEQPYETLPVVVTGTHRHSGVGHEDELGSVLRGKQLDRELGLSLAATLRNEVGVAMRSMGPAPARPVIRGLGGDRVFLAEDGVKTVDLSSTSPDHAVTIEPFGAERIEVLRGPRVLTKSPVTIGGMVNVVRHEIPLDPHDTILGALGLYGESANRGYLGSLTLEAPLRPVLLRGEISRRETGDMRTPAGELRNSWSRTLNMALGGSVVREQGMVGAAQRHYALSYGVPGGFIGAHPNGVDIEMERRQSSVKASLTAPVHFLHDIGITAARTYYRHKEFEASGLIGSEFLVVDWQGTLQANHHGFDVVDEGSFGVYAAYRDIGFGGYVFTIPATSLAIAPFLYERFHVGVFSFEAGARYNFDRITPQREKSDARIGHIRERVFHTWSASLSMLYPLTDIVRLGANISRSSRVPTIEELYSEGPHLAAYSYEVGDPELEAERGIGLELFITHEFDGLSWNVSAFRNTLSSFITPRNTGTINYSTFLPIYRSSGVEAVLQGFEAQLDWDASERIRVELSAAWTHGGFAGDGEPLPSIPPLKARIALTWREASWQVGVSSDAAARQDRVDTFEQPTAGYAILNAFAQYTRVAGGLVHNLSLNADNLLDHEYRNHLSRVKSILPEAGFNVRATYKVHFTL